MSRKEEKEEKNENQGTCSERKDAVAQVLLWYESNASENDACGDTSTFITEKDCLALPNPTSDALLQVGCGVLSDWLGQAK